MAKYLVTIGLEIHAELKTKTKMFCDSLNDPNEKHPNVNVCPICMGHPGALPVINQEAIKKLITVGLALNCSINRKTFFERKNYFYPDLPKGYQISQFQKPICYDGYLEISNLKSQISNNDQAPNFKHIRIERIHLEEDAGRLYHQGSLSTHDSGRQATLVDYNRAGLPLMELVTKPDLETAQDVLKFAQELRLMLRYLGASDADMEKGQMRVEVNISLRPEHAKELGTKVEVKNINSISAAAKAVEYETKRQSEILDEGGKIVQETRGWDDINLKTVSQRTKEGSADYRYFPEPDLPPLSFKDEDIDAIRSEIPELPVARRRRFLEEYNLPERDIEVFTTNKSLGNYFEKVASGLLVDKPEHKDRLIKLAANYLITELSRMAAEVGTQPEETKITPEMFADLIVRTSKGEISSSAAQVVLKEMFETGKIPEDIIKEKDLGQVSDLAGLDSVVEQVISEHHQAVEDFKKGKEASIKYLVGKVMATSRGKANPQMVEQILKNKLKIKDQK